MTKVRRVIPRRGLRRTARPEVQAEVTAETMRARQISIVHLFPHDGTLMDGDAGSCEGNLFADLGDLRPVDRRVSAARDRIRRRLPLADLPEIDNLFAEDCPDMPEQVLENTVSLFRARPRPLEAAREQIVAYHDEQAHHGLGEMLHLPLPRVAAGVFGLAALIHLGGGSPL